ncbi:MAG: site-specific integrase [Lachnospiraceae bacterium]|nr:site-specific integrase [Lachnospiraceae bacterium]
MAGRKDSKGRVLRPGEFERSSDGRIAYTYRDPLGRRQYIYSRDLMELRRKEDKIKRDLLDGLDTYARGQATLNATFDRYIAIKNNLRDSTKNGYISTYERYVRDTFGKKKIAEIKYSDVYQYYNYLLTDVKLALATLDTVHCLLHPTFQLAVRDDIIRKNPSDGIMAEISKNTDSARGSRHALTSEQQAAFMEYISDHPVYNHWYQLFAILLGTGTRIGECLGLTWSDIDFDNRFISINHTIAYYPTEGTRSAALRVHRPKTKAGIRRIPMMKQVKDALYVIKDEQEELELESPELDGLTGFIFTNRYGAVVNPQSVNRAIKRIISSYNCEEELEAARKNREPLLLPNFSCHNLRHTFATRMCQACDNYKAIQSVMGHKSAVTTLDIYADASDDTNQMIFDILSDKLEDLF